MFFDLADHVCREGRVPWVVLPMMVAAIGGVALGQEAREVTVRVRFAADPPLTEDELSRLRLLSGLVTPRSSHRGGRTRNRTPEGMDLVFRASSFEDPRSPEVILSVKADPPTPFRAELRRPIRLADFGPDGRMTVDLEIVRRERLRVWIQLVDRTTGEALVDQPVAAIERRPTEDVSLGPRVRTDAEGIVAFDVWTDSPHYLVVTSGDIIPLESVSNVGNWSLPERPDTKRDQPLIWEIDVPWHSVQGRVALETQDGQREPTPEVIDRLSLLRNDGTHLRTRQVIDGRFDIYDLEPGTYHLAVDRALAPGYEVARGATFRIRANRDETLEHEVVVGLRQRARCDFLVIDKETGQPIADARVTLREDGGFEQFTTDKHGRGRVRSWEGAHTLLARAKRYAEHTAVLSLENRRTYQIPLTPLKRTDVVVLGWNGRPLGDATVMFACSRLLSAADGATATSGPNGRAELYGAPVSPLVLVVTRDAQWCYFGRVDVPRTEPLQLRLSDLITLRGQVEGQIDIPSKAFPLDLRHRMYGGIGLVDDDGRFTLHVAPGRYGIYVLQEIAKDQADSGVSRSIEQVAYPIGTFEATADERTAERTFRFDEEARKKATTPEAVLGW